MEPNQKNEESRKKWLNTYGRYAGIGFQMAGSILLFTWLGKLADDSMENKNSLLTLAGAVVGITLGMYFLFKAVSVK